MNICLNATSKKIISMLDKLDLDIGINNSLKPLYTTFIKEYQKIEVYKLSKETKSIKITNQLPNILKSLNRMNSVNLEDPELKRLVNKHITDKTLPKKIMDKIIDDNLYSEYSSYDILSSIDKINKSTTIKLDTFNLTIYYTNSIKKSHIDTILKRCLILSRVHNLKEQINIKLWLTNAKKKRPNYAILGAREVNSGLTTISLIHRETTILRKEEYKKLIIHELIHYLDLDFKDSCTFDFSKHFNISPTISIKLYESYTEVCAVIINCILSSYEVNNRKNKELFNKFICYEIKFSLFQIAKILLFYKFKNISDFIKPYDGKDRFKQTTPVFSYFFVKSALLFNLSSFSKFLYDNCELFKFKTTQDKYVDLVQHCCKNKKFLNSIQEYMDYIQKHKLSSLIKNTIRMTCIECL